MSFKLFVYGLWFALLYFGFAVLGEAVFPGSLKDTAFTDLGILSFFSVLVLDSLFTLRSVD